MKAPLKGQPLGWLRHPAKVALTALALGLVFGCDDTPDLALGPPRCEPARELDLERSLKAGFRALYEGDFERARASFSAVETEEPGHPEAALGLRLANTAKNGRQVVPPSNTAHTSGARREVLVAGERLEVPLEVVTDALRLEGLAELRAARKTPGPPPDLSYGKRARGNQTVDPAKVDDVRAAVELIVLHDTFTATRPERVAALDEQRASVHFIVDWDGRVFQVLDLAFAARHTGDVVLDSRSVGIELVNPVALDQSGVLPDGTERSRSERVSVQGLEVVQWGYTEAQLTSLEHLIDGLLVVFPQVARKVPQSAGGVVPRIVLSGREAELSQGIVGHLHLSKDASDPGAAFPWDRLVKHLAR